MGKHRNEKRERPERCCGTCIMHLYDPEEKDWACMEESSDNFGLETEYVEVCGEWVGKD